MFLGLLQLTLNPGRLLLWSTDKAARLADFGDDDYRHMVCLEVAACRPAISLAPGVECRGKQYIRLTSL